MCGFYYSNQHPNSYDFVDVTQRGFEYKTYSSNNYFAVQSVLPCVNNIDWNLYESEDHLFLFTGEIYNYNRSFSSDTEMFLYDLINNNDIRHYNGMYAYVFLDKSTNKLRYGRDKTGQIPLFIYNKDNHIVISNTIKSIVKTVDTELNINSLNLWKKSKHYIFQETPWMHIYSVTPSSDEIDYEHKSVEENFQDLISDYDSALCSASINSGGVDSGIVSHWFGDFQVAINHVGKDYISSNLDYSIDITEEEWCHYTDEFIEATYLFPYSWSWVGYYIMGKKLHNKINILYTGEGADEIFGGYPDYGKRIRTPYSKPFKINKNNFLVNNKLSDQKYFIPTSAMGANLALGCWTIEPRSPFLDRRFMNDKQNLSEDNKKSLKDYYKSIYKKLPLPKQGFAGYPNEYYNHVFKTNIDQFDSNNFWKIAAYESLTRLK
jgi:asparagine synthase (glutamine-hydrolysing)